MKKLPFISIVAIILFAGCSTSNKFASSFGKRRYTKGYYVDAPGNVKIPSENKTSAPVTPKTPAIVYVEPAKEIVSQTTQPVSIHTDKHAINISKPATTQFVKPLTINNIPNLVSALGDHNGGMHNAKDGDISSGKHSILAGLCFIAFIVLDAIADELELHAILTGFFGTLVLIALVLSLINAFKAIKRKEKYYGIGIAVITVFALALLLSLVIIVALLFVGGM